LKEKARWVEVAGGVSLSELEDLACSGGRERAIAVSRRASSRVLVGLVVRGCGVELASAVVKVPGSILPMNVQRFLLGAPVGSAVSFGLALSALSSLARDAREECRL